MKNNTGESKMLLEKALKNLPLDGSLQQVRRHLKCALEEIQHVEGKRHKREIISKTVEEEYKEKMGKCFIAPQNAPSLLNTIDQMIEQEQKKIGKMQEKVNAPTPQVDTDTIFD
jgi:flagellar biosynthesis chaperone FliJ